MALLSRRRLLVLAAVASLAGLAGGAVWLPRAAPGRLVLGAHEVLLVAALAEVAYPAGNAIGVDWREADVVGGVDRVLADVLSPVSSAGFRHLLHLLDHGAWLAGYGRFATLPLEERRVVLTALAHLEVLPGSALSDALKAVLGMAYFEHPAVLDRLGWGLGCAVARRSAP